MSWLHRTLGKDGSSQLEIDSAFFAGRERVMPIPYGALGHYRLAVRINSTAVQVANSRIFQVRNAGTNILVLTRLVIRAYQTAAGTAQENSVDCYKLTGFSAVDTTNTVTPVWSTKKTSMGVSTNIHVRALSPNANGMTGGTLTKDTTSFFTLPYMVATAAGTTNAAQWGPADATDDLHGTHPFVFVNNEGFGIESRVLNVTSMGITWYVDCSLAEVPTTAF